MLTQRVWNMAADANTNIVDVYIKYLRDKIDGNHEEKLIRTVRGMGYSLQVPSANPLQAVA
jgi:two-component system copper resistance phosphate regulon response regulator CusR